MINEKNIELGSLEDSWSKIESKLLSAARDNNLETPETYNMNSVGHIVYQTQYELTANGEFNISSLVEMKTFINGLQTDDIHTFDLNSYISASKPSS